MYFKVFLVFAEMMLDSKLQVNSSKYIFLSCQFNITRSGLDVVSIRWGSATVEIKVRNVGENFNVFRF